MEQQRHVALLYGGWSAERQVSLWSGEACAKAAEQEGFRVTKVDVQRDIATVLEALRPDVALNMLHGPYGEDGCIQGVLEILGIPYSHSGVLPSALAMNKPMAKRIMEKAGVPLAEGKVVSRFDAAKTHMFPAPYVIKPIAQGSTVGVIIVHDDSVDPPSQLLGNDWIYGDEILVERYIAGRELTCAVMGGKALDVIEMQYESEIYDFDAKYSKGGSRHILPAQLPDRIYKEILSQSASAYASLGCRGVARVDFRYDDRSDTLACLEVNTQPGMTATSLVPEIAAHNGIAFPQLVRWMIEDASTNR
jgi:D-alanine-D-alanine ligase